jgi:excisionase family DNA binding protein
MTARSINSEGNTVSDAPLVLEGSSPNRCKPLTVRVRDACRMTGIGRSKLYELIASGDIRTIKVGSITLIPTASLEQFLGLE